MKLIGRRCGKYHEGKGAGHPLNLKKIFKTTN